MIIDQKREYESYQSFYHFRTLIPCHVPVREVKHHESIERQYRG